MLQYAVNCQLNDSTRVRFGGDAAEAAAPAESTWPCSPLAGVTDAIKGWVQLLSDTDKRGTLGKKLGYRSSIDTPNQPLTTA